MPPKVQGTKNRRAVAIQEAEVLSSVKGLNLDTVTRGITDTQVEIQKTLADLSGKLTEQLQQLENIEGAIQLKREELKQLHDIELKAQSLDELEAQIAQTRQSWEMEQATKKRDFAEQQSLRNKDWRREEEEYQYRLSQEHRKLEDSFKELMAQREKENRNKQEDLEKNWNEREVELKKREQELVELRKFKEEYPDLVKKEVNGAVAVATNSVKKEYETQKTIAAKDAETEKRLADQTIASLQQTIVKQQAQIDETRAQLEMARSEVKEIAAKALDSASGRATTEALQRLMEKEQITSKTGK
jgi:hypothetical protein